MSETSYLINRLAELMENPYVREAIELKLAQEQAALIAEQELDG